MQESIGGVQLFIIVVTIVLLFSGIMALTVNHSNAFAVKDQIVQIIEKHDGFTFNGSSKSEDIKRDKEVIDEIKESLVKSSYRSNGQCTTYNGAKTMGYQRDGREDKSLKKSAFCITRVSSNSGSLSSGYYYKVEVFYHLDIPVLSSFLNLRVRGETKKLYS